MTTPIAFPTVPHQRAAEEIVAFFDTAPEVAVVLLVNSLARGAGTPESDLDIIRASRSVGRVSDVTWAERCAYLLGLTQLGASAPF